MTHRLLVNPDTPQAWEIPLLPGTIRIGRRADNDRQVNHPSISGTHCEIIVDDAGVQIRDLGSTNGTFVNRTAVREAQLVSGQHLQLGSVDMRFETIGAVPAMAPAPAPPAIPTTRSPLRFADLRSARVEPPLPPPEEEPPEPPLPPPLVAPTALANAGQFFCKSHAKTPARFLCPKCGKYFCELCVTTRATPGGAGKFCRTCGSALTPLQVHLSRPGKQKGFYSRLPGAFVYPFKGFGLAILLLATFCFGGVDYLVSIGFLVGPFGWAIRFAFYGLLFLFMQNIIYTTTSDENEPLGFPDASELFGAAFQLLGTILVSFALPIGLLVARIFGVEIPMAAIVASALLGCLYFPMAFLAVAMKDTVMAANPLIVIPAILRLPLEYFVTTLLSMAIFGLRFLGGMVSGSAGSDTLTTKETSTLFLSLGIQAGWAFFSIYLLTVNMRVLGLLYNAKKEKFGWFSH